MERLQGVLARLELALAVAMMVAMVTLVFMAALSRYVAVPINWSVDAAQGLFVWIVFLGASQALRRRRHIGVGVFMERVPQRFRLYVRLALDILTVVFLAMVIRYAILVSIVNSGRQFPSFAMSYSWVTIAAAVGGGLMLITKLSDIAETARQIRQRS